MSFFLQKMRRSSPLLIAEFVAQPRMNQFKSTHRGWYAGKCVKRCIANIRGWQPSLNLQKHALSIRAALKSEGKIKAELRF
jgi:hypothetical protein